MTRKRKTQRRSRQHARKPRLEALEGRRLLAADVPFDGAAVLYQVHGVSGNQGQLSTIDVATGDFNNVGNAAGYKVNATGYRTADNFIYGIKVTSRELVKLDATGAVENLGSIDGLPSRNYYSADFGPDGLLYLWTNQTLYGVDVDTQSVEREVSLSRKTGSTPDIAYNPDTGLMYGVERNGKTSAFISIDVTDGSVQTINNDFDPSGTYGAMFADATGRVFAGSNKGGIYEVDLATGEPTFAGYSPVASSNDGSSPSTAVINLPPVALKEWASAAAGATDYGLGITEPLDPEGNAITIQISGLPDIGTVKHADGSSVSIGDSLTASQLASLVYDAPVAAAGQDAGMLTYEVSDGSSTVVGCLDIEIGGLSRLGGSVLIDHDSDDQVYGGYAFGNEITLTGEAIDGTQVTATTETDIFGNFHFEDVAPGTYTLVQQQPEVVGDAYTVAGKLGGTESENSIVDIVVPVGDAAEYLDNQFVEYAPAAISGFVHVDANMNGELESTEVGIAGVELTLTGIDDLGQAVSVTATTDSFGFYEFTGLRPGEYSLTEDQPENYLDSSSEAGTVGGTESLNAITDIDLGAGDNAQLYNFGELVPNSVSGHVFLDNDWDGVYDKGDMPIEQIAVTLTGVDDLGNNVSLTTQTDESGKYEFNDLVSGTYTVTQTEQPTGLEDGRTNVGVFSGKSASEEANGVAIDNQVSGIVLGQDDRAMGYDFAETLVYQLMAEYDVQTVFYGTGGRDVFEFVAGSDFHQVTLNGEVTLLDASLRHHVKFMGYGGTDKAYITGTDDVETVRLRPTYADYHARTFRVNTYHTERATAYNGGGFDRVYMYDSAGDDILRATEDYQLIYGDGFYNIAHGFHRSYTYGTRGGYDRAVMTDSKRDDTFKASSENARMFGRDYYNFVRGFDRVNAKSVNGGFDQATLWDSTADQDIFQSTTKFARIYNTTVGFYNHAEGFDRVKALANQGGVNDRAYFLDSAGDDILVSSPQETGITTDAYTHSSEGFERMYAFSSEGNDRAFLYDSKADDIFRSSPEDSRLYNDEYYLKVTNYSQVDAFSSGGGNDRAYFYDSAGDETLIAHENEVRMYGDSFDNTSHGFSRAYAFATAGGNDRAIMYDSDQADTVNISDGLTRMYGEGYYTRAEAFDKLDTVFSDLSTRDRALIFGGMSQDTVNRAGDLASHITGNSASYIYGADAVASLLGSDVENDAFVAPGEDGDTFDLDLKDF